MKVVLKNGNYVVDVKKNSKIAKKIETANNDEKVISRILLDAAESKCKNAEHARNVFINFTAWGILLSAVKASGNYDSDILDYLASYVYGFTLVCGAAGLLSAAVTRHYDKKYYKFLEMYNDIALTRKDDEIDNNEKENEIDNKKML